MLQSSSWNGTLNINRDNKQRISRLRNVLVAQQILRISYFYHVKCCTVLQQMQINLEILNRIIIWIVDSS